MTGVRFVHDDNVLPSRRYWWACTRPEGAPDHWTAYDERCRGCRLAAMSHVRGNAVNADVLRTRTDYAGALIGGMTLREWSERYPP